MGRKKTGRISNVRVETGLMRKAKLISADRGISVAECVSAALKVAIDRDWPRFARKIAEQAEAEK